MDEKQRLLSNNPFIKNDEIKAYKYEQKEKHKIRIEERKSYFINKTYGYRIWNSFSLEKLKIK
jgi:hypothetical protein